MKNAMLKINMLLLCSIVFLGLALTRANLSSVQAQTGGTEDFPGFNYNTPFYTNCERWIDMTGMCYPSQGWNTTWRNRRVICKSQDVEWNNPLTLEPPSGGCCEYEAMDKYCEKAGNPPYPRGYKAAYLREFQNKECACTTAPGMWCI